MDEEDDDENSEETTIKFDYDNDKLINIRSKKSLNDISKPKTLNRRNIPQKLLDDNLWEW